MKQQTRDSDIHYEGNAFLRLLGYMKSHLGAFCVCLFLVLLATVMDLYRPILIGNAIDRYIIADAGSGLTADARFLGVLRSCGIYALLLVLLFVCNHYQYMLLQKTGQDIIYDIRNQLFEHVESLTMRYFDVTPVGRIVTRITNDVEAINDVYSNILVRLVQNVAKIIALAVIMLIMNTRLALTCFALVPVVVFLTVLFRTLSRRAYQVSRTRLTTLNTFLSEHLSGMRIIQVFAKEKEKGQAFSDRSEELFQANFKEILIDAIFRPATYMTYVTALFVLLLAGSSRVISGEISIGTLYIFIQYMDSFFNPIQELAQQFSTLQSAIASAEKIFTLLDTKPDIPEDVQPTILPSVRGRIEFDHVWFAYQGEDWVLKDVSFTIEPGCRVAFVGATGAGKTSILSLIGRYYDIQKGAIRIDGVDIRLLSREQIRRSIGQVQQDVFLFTGTVASNIRLRDETISDHQVMEAAHTVHAHHFIEALPQGYDQPVSERGATFSQGERQLLSFARTLAYDPAILILDEATASIDTQTEQYIQAALARLMQGRTCIMVAHRLSTIQNADCILVMHHGRIRERGTHQQLLAQGGIYAKLYELQIA